MKKEPKISILCITYNQEKYIRQALESFVMQKTNFDFEILIHDDASNDGTQDIIREFQNKYPEKIKTFFQKENQYSKGVRGIMMKFLLPEAKGEYIALCEGDDFFIDEDKLQLQSDFLDENHDYALCFHPVRIFFEDGEEFDSIHPDYNNLPELTLIELLKNNFIPTMSVMYRRNKYENMPETNFIPGDWYLHLFHARFGKIGFINRVMSAYRRQHNGIWWDSYNNNESLFKRHGVQFIAMYFELLNLFEENFKYKQVIYYHINYLLNTIIAIDKKENSKILESILLEFPKDMLKIVEEYSLNINDFKEIISKKDELIQEKEAIIQEKEDALYDLYHSRILMPVIKLRNKLRVYNHHRKSLFSKVEGLILYYSKKLLSERIRIFIRPLLPVRYRLRISIVSNEKWDGPLISVITPFFNHGKTINATVESVLGQTFQNFEYIIVNDGSLDIESKDAFERINNSKILKISQENSGVASARNNGIKMARGKYIVCLDSDDIIDVTYLEKMVTLLESHPDVDIAYSHMKFFGIEERLYKEPEFNPKLLYNSNIIPVASVFKRNAWEKCGGYKSNIGFEDWELWINLVENGSKAKLVSEPIFLYRRAAESRYINDKKKADENIGKIRKLHPDYLNKISKFRERWTMQRSIFKDGSKFVNLSDSSFYLQGNENKKNVLVLMPWLTFGGAETLVYNYCSRLKNDFNISMITSLKSENEWEYKFKEITGNIYHLPNLFQREDEYLEFVKNYIRSRQIDVVHIVHNSSFYAMLPEIKQEFPQLKVISTVFNTIADHFNNSVKFAGYIDAFTTDNSKVLKAYDQQEELKDIEKILIPNGIDCTKFDLCSYDRSVERKTVGIANDDLAVYFIGRLSPEKNPDVFVEAAKKVLAKFANVKFFIIGDGPMRKNIEKSVKEFNNKCLNYLGYQTDIPRYLSTADVFVLPSKAEGFPLSNIEAMSMGVCVIASDVGGVSDAVRDGENGFLMQPNSSDELASKIEHVLKQKNILNDISRNARKSVEENFSIEILAEKYKNLYN